MKKTDFYHTCPYCGAHLDPCERCDCEMAKEADEKRLLELLAGMTEAEKNELLIFTRFLLDRQEQGLPVTDEECAQMLEAAKERLAMTA